MAQKVSRLIDRRLSANARKKGDPTLAGVMVSGWGQHGKTATVCRVVAAFEDQAALPGRQQSAEVSQPTSSRPSRACRWTTQEPISASPRLGWQPGEDSAPWRSACTVAEPICPCCSNVSPITSLTSRLWTTPPDGNASRTGLSPSRTCRGSSRTTPADADSSPAAPREALGYASRRLLRPGLVPAHWQ
ncbi:hypothetical protein EAO72_34080 [Streptomyces sp. or43]|nr:hypothetical protein EAO72_34080 [Streptomyces sp. or43]